MWPLVSLVVIEDLVAIVFVGAITEVALRSLDEIAWICLQDVEVVLAEVELSINHLRHLVRQDPQSRRFVELRKRKLEKNKKCGVVLLTMMSTG